MDGDHQASVPFYFREDAFEAAQGTMLYEYGLTDLYVGIGGDKQARFNHFAYPIDLSVGNVLGHLAKPDHVHDAGSGKYRKAVAGVKTAKKVARKQELIDLFGAVGPTSFDSIRWREFLVPPLSQMRSGYALIVGAKPQGKPRLYRQTRLGRGQVAFLGIQSVIQYPDSRNNRLTDRLIFVNISLGPLL